MRDLKEVTNLTYNDVLSGFQGEHPIILKLVFDNAGLKQEACALKCFSGCGAVKVLAEDEGMLLLERAVPGTSLKRYFPDREQESIEIACRVMKNLHQANIPKDHIFPHIKDGLAALDKDWNIPDEYLQKARKIRDQLLKSAGPDVLLHGDLHQDNILKNGDDWVMIDPKGAIGERSYEAAAFIRNPMPELLTHADALNIIHNRITRFAELLELPSQRILNWCFVQAVLAWIWEIEDSSAEALAKGDGSSYFEQLTQIFDTALSIKEK